jgi:hypothetical protein
MSSETGRNFGRVALTSGVLMHTWLKIGRVDNYSLTAAVSSFAFGGRLRAGNAVWFEPVQVSWKGSG